MDGALSRGHPAVWSAAVSIHWTSVFRSVTLYYCVGLLALNLLPEMLPAPMLFSHLQPTPPATSLAPSCYRET